MVIVQFEITKNLDELLDHIMDCWKLTIFVTENGDLLPLTRSIM